MSRRELFNRWSSAECLPLDHIFRRRDFQAYREGFVDAATAAYSSCSDTQVQQIARHKFLLEHDRTWNRDLFIQSSCELVIGAHYALLCGVQVEPDARVGDTSKDVDWRVVLPDFRLNVEIKCSIENEPATSSKEVNLIFLGRVDDPNRSQHEMSELLSKVGYETRTPKHADNRLKDFLVNAHAKFSSERPPSELNVLIVCCGTPYNMNRWRGYLKGNQGLFAANPFHDPRTYGNVDVVVLSSLRYLHETDAALNAGSWRLMNTFNVAFANPRTTRPIDSECYSAFLDSFPNHTREYQQFEPSYAAGTPVAREVKMYHFPIEKLNAATRARLWPAYEFPRDRE